MTEYSPDLGTNSEHIRAMRMKLLADIAIAQALREGYSNTGDLEIKCEVIEGDK